MGLDGYVACNCIEKGIAEIPEAIARLVKIDADTGCSYLDSQDKNLRQTYSRWRSSKPCAHENFYILELRLGNIDGIGRLRKLLKAADFPVLCGKVIHSAVHSGDAVPVEDLKRLQDELRRLRSIGPETQPFANLLEALVEAALQAGKPIGF